MIETKLHILLVKLYMGFIKVLNSVRRGVAAKPSLKPWNSRRGYDVFQGVPYGGKSLYHIQYYIHKYMFS